MRGGSSGRSQPPIGLHHHGIVIEQINCPLPPHLHVLEAKKWSATCEGAREPGDGMGMGTISVQEMVQWADIESWGCLSLSDGNNGSFQAASRKLLLWTTGKFYFSRQVTVSVQFFAVKTHRWLILSWDVRFNRYRVPKFQIKIFRKDLSSTLNKYLYSRSPGTDYSTNLSDDFVKIFHASSHIYLL